MKHLIILIAVLGLFFPICLPAQTELRIMSMNTEWFWDSEEPHEGSAVGPRGNPPTELEVKLEAFAIARIIEENKINLAGFIEVENRNVVDMVRSYLKDENWETVFLEGRDNITGQDVALLTRFEVIQGTETNYGDISGIRRPSKILGVGLKVDSKTIFVIVTHFLSKRSDNDENRLHQAAYVRSRALVTVNNFDHMIIMGDLNDLPDSDPVKMVLGKEDPEADFLQTAITTGPDPAYSYIFNEQKQLIDYILLSPSFLTDFNDADASTRYKTVDLGPVSDHRAVMVDFVIN